MTMLQGEAQAWPKPRGRSIIPGSKLDELILSELYSSPVPLSAYTIADRLRDQGHHVVIPSLYRGLRRLSSTGEIEKVEMLAAYRIAEGQKHLRLVCLGCGRTTAHPVPELYDLLIARAKETGFDISKVALELGGRCPTCSEHEDVVQPLEDG
ncbi:MAG: transcriptional repressor [Sphingobium sp.]